MSAVPIDVVRQLPDRPAPPNVPLNRNLRGLGPSATLANNERSAQLRRQGRRV